MSREQLYAHSKHKCTHAQLTAGLAGLSEDNKIAEK